MPTPPMAVKRFFAKQLARPTGLFGRFIMVRFLNAVTLSHNQLVLEQLAISRTDRVLEVGFGGGALLRRIIPLVPDGSVAGVEISEEMISHARSLFRAQIAARRVELYHGKVESLPYADASFDKACSVNTIYFWPDLALALAELARVIRPGGVLVLGFTSIDDVRSAGLDRLGFMPRSSDELALALAAHGFRPGLLQSGSDRRGTFFALTAERIAHKPTRR